MSVCDESEISLVLSRISEIKNLLPDTVPWHIFHEAVGLLPNLEIDKNSGDMKCHGTEQVRLSKKLNLIFLPILIENDTEDENICREKNENEIFRFPV